MQGLNLSLTRESTFVAKGETNGRNTDFTEGLGTATAPLLHQEAVHWTITLPRTWRTLLMSSWCMKGFRRTSHGPAKSPASITSA
jgi:hypothetical protein